MSTTSAIFLNEALDVSRDVVVSFDYACYGQAAQAGDGFCLWFTDITQFYSYAGGPGPGLGYCPVSGVNAWTGNSTYNGLAYGSLGIGFDITGNFSVSSYCYNGYANPSPNTINIRSNYINNYQLLYTSPTLSTFNTPVSLYQQVTGSPVYNRVRVRITDFGQRILIDMKEVLPDTPFTNYVDFTLPYNVFPPSLAAGLSFSSGLTSAQFKITNFTINSFVPSIFTTTYTYSAASYFNMAPDPVTLTIYDILSSTDGVLNINAGGAPYTSGDGFVVIA